MARNGTILLPLKSSCQKSTYRSCGKRCLFFLCATTRAPALGTPSRRPAFDDVPSGEGPSSRQRERGKPETAPERPVGASSEGGFSEHDLAVALSTEITLPVILLEDVRKVFHNRGEVLRSRRREAGFVHRLVPSHLENPLREKMSRIIKKP
jgi:hypothetical protein